MNEVLESNAELTQMVHSLMPLTASLGFEVVEGGPERVVARTNWAPEYCTTGGVLHGGYLMAVADSAGAACAGLNLPQGAIMTTIESKTNFFRGVTEGFIEVVATPVHIGRTTIVVQTDITDGRGKHVSRTIQTQAVILPR
jgi:1,4-dihydroxy-2-naphthoyl-CoA hydrolase